jgi:hypothetical protein
VDDALVLMDRCSDAQYQRLEMLLITTGDKAIHRRGMGVKHSLPRLECQIPAIQVLERREDGELIIKHTALLVFGVVMRGWNDHLAKQVSFEKREQDVPAAGSSLSSCF